MSFHRSTARGILPGVPTFFDQSVRGPDEAWRSLRRRRTSPPVPPASPKAHADTFRGALEQAEQQFRAAASIGYDSCALNLYYGASQAGRALAPAASALGNEEWALSGHGLKCPGLANAGTDVSALSVRPEGGEGMSFRRLSRVLGSPLPGDVGLGALWPLLYERVCCVGLGAVVRTGWPGAAKTVQGSRSVGVVLRRVPVPAWRDHRRCPLVPALRAVLP